MMQAMCLISGLEVARRKCPVLSKAENQPDWPQEAQNSQEDKNVLEHFEWMIDSSRPAFVFFCASCGQIVFLYSHQSQKKSDGKPCRFFRSPCGRFRSSEDYVKAMVSRKRSRPQGDVELPETYNR